MVCCKTLADVGASEGDLASQAESIALHTRRLASELAELAELAKLAELAELAELAAPHAAVASAVARIPGVAEGALSALRPGGRCIDALSALAELDTECSAAIAQMSDLPRPPVYRVLNEVDGLKLHAGRSLYYVSCLYH